MNRTRPPHPRPRARRVARVTMHGALALAAGLAIVIGYDRLHPATSATTMPPSTYAVPSSALPAATPRGATSTAPVVTLPSARRTGPGPSSPSTSASVTTGWALQKAPADVAASFAEATRGLGVVGAAYAVVGRSGTIRTVGTWQAGPAWSTAKVPLAVAALRRPTGTTRQLLQAALTRSDNAAAEALWAQLGGGEPAATLVDGQLRRLGDATTHIQARRVRPPYTPFGQTTWSLDAQVRVAAALACSRDAVDRDILTAMGRVVAEQRWGLGQFPGAAVKGGWGPDPAGRYLVRQFGVARVDGTTLAVAVAAEPVDGSFGSGTRALDVMTAWLARSGQAAALPSTPC